MDRGNTKQEILEAALELFSVQGVEATSISQIASAVGIRKASLYSHFGCVGERSTGPACDAFYFCKGRLGERCQ